MLISDTRPPATVPEVPVAPGVSLLLVHAAVTPAASVRATIVGPDNLMCIAFLLHGCESSRSRKLQLLPRIDQIRIVDEISVCLVDRPPLVGIAILTFGDFRQAVAFDDDVRLFRPDRAGWLRRRGR